MGEKLNICFMTHNAYHPALEKESKYNTNINIDTFGSSLSYLLLRKYGDYHVKNYQEFARINDYDLIILDGLLYDDLTNDILKSIIKTMSLAHQKRVTYAYSFDIPEKLRTSNTRNKIYICSSYDEIDYTNIIEIEDEFFHSVDLLNVVIEEHEKIKHNIEL